MQLGRRLARRTVLIPAIAALSLASAAFGGTFGLVDAKATSPARAERVPAALPASRGRTLYVSPSGSDDNAGTRARPWRTLEHAFDRLKPGERLLVRAGTYVESPSLRRSGLPNAPITVRAYPGERPVVTREVTISGSYVRLYGLTLDLSTAASSDGVPLYVEGGDHVEIARNEIRHGRMSGIFLGDENSDGSDYARIVGNWIHDNGIHEHFDHGIYYGAGSGGLIANNLIENNLAFGIQLFPDCDGAVVTGNTIVGHGMSGIVVGGDTRGAADGNLIVNNVLAFNAGTGLATYWESAVGHNVAENNLAFGNGDGDYPSGNDSGGVRLVRNFSGNPRFVARASHNYRLAISSAARNRAVARYALPTDYTGRRRADGRPDLGAFER